MTLASATYLLLNYGGDDFPAVLYLFCNELGGMSDENSENHGIVGIMTPNGAPQAVINEGGIIGWNVAYKLAEPTPNYDVSTIPNLTFDIGLKPDKTDQISYPMNQPLIMGLTVSHVAF